MKSKCIIYPCSVSPFVIKSLNSISRGKALKISKLLFDKLKLIILYDVIMLTELSCSLGWVLTSWVSYF